ncbi:MAG: hypothetical protein ACLQJR_29655 [Stellaceae bacterium]
MKSISSYWMIGVLLALSFAAGPAFAGGCNLDPVNGRIKHVVYLQFDNVHLRRDNPNVPSDLEQIPNLLSFLVDDGTLLTNHHTPLISHTSVDIVTSLTGVYGEKFGFGVGNSFGYFFDGAIKFASSFTYWTDQLLDGTYEMIDQNGNNAPAPWVPFTRAGCDVGAFSIANIEFENITSDITNVFGASSPQASEASTNPTLATADFEGIIIHCAQGSALCTKGAPDLLPQEPGGYSGFNALYGNVNVAPAINHGAACVNDLDGNPVADSHGNCGFPGFDPRPAQSLGYVATMLEAGVQVVYFYIEDAHDNDPGLSGVPASVAGTFGPGEAGYVTQLQAYNKAFGEFFARLEKDGITKDNTLFIITADENDHFVGGPPSPANCDGVTIPCTYAKKGEIDADLSLLFNTEFSNTTPFSVHSDDAPTFYIDGNPSPTTSVTRTLERQAGQLVGFDPVVGPSGSNNLVTQALADPAEEALLHMISFEANRTPNFVLFGNPDYFLSASGNTTPTCTPTTGSGLYASCFTEGTGFAWNHGDFQNQITHTWLGIVGPGVKAQGRLGSFFTDHTDIRPTLLRLVGLTDDYAHDGRVIVEALEEESLPRALRENLVTLSLLGQAYKQINAPRGTLGRRTLTGISTRALKSSDPGDITYFNLEAEIAELTARRNAIAGPMIDMLEGAAFQNQPIDEPQALALILRADALLDSVPGPSASPHGQVSAGPPM